MQRSCCMGRTISSWTCQGSPCGNLGSLTDLSSHTVGSVGSEWSTPCGSRYTSHSTRVCRPSLAPHRSNTAAWASSGTAVYSADLASATGPQSWAKCSAPSAALKVQFEFGHSPASLTSVWSRISLLWKAWFQNSTGTWDMLCWYCDLSLGRL